MEYLQTPNENTCLLHGGQLSGDGNSASLANSAWTDPEDWVVWQDTNAIPAQIGLLRPIFLSCAVSDEEWRTITSWTARKNASEIKSAFSQHIGTIVALPTLTEDKRKAMGF